MSRKNLPLPLRREVDVVGCIQPYLSSGEAVGAPRISDRPSQLAVRTRRFHDAMVVDAFGSGSYASRRVGSVGPTMVGGKRCMRIPSVPVGTRSITACSLQPRYAPWNPRSVCDCCDEVGGPSFLSRRKSGVNGPESIATAREALGDALRARDAHVLLAAEGADQFALPGVILRLVCVR
jgi:hypothetical protein